MGQDNVDLGALDTRAGANAGFWLQLRHPGTNAPIAARLKLLGMDSQRYREKSNEMMRARQEELSRGAAQRLSPEEIERRNVELLVAVTVSWERLSLDGAPYEYADGKARELYARWPWIYEQANQAVVDRGNFLPGSASS